MKKLYILFLSSMFLVGCGLFGSDVVTVKVEQDGVTINETKANNGDCVSVELNDDITEVVIDIEAREANSNVTPPVVAKEAVKETKKEGNWLVKGHEVAEAGKACESASN